MGLRAQANANYFSSLATQQRYQQDVYQATSRQRNFDTTLTGSWGAYMLSARAEQRDYFDNNETLTRTGSLPRINLSHAEKPIGRIADLLRGQRRVRRISSAARGVTISS